MTDLRALAAEIRADPAPLDAYAGRSLADAFAAVVLRDARFWDAQRSVLGRTVGEMTCNSGGDGRLWPSRSGLWPVSLFPWPHDLIAGWLDPNVVRYGTEVDANGDELHQPWANPSDELTPIHDAADVVAALLGRFLAPLRDGRVAASGHPTSGGMALGPISSAMWSRPATRFDAINSGIARRTGWSVEQCDNAKNFRFEALVDEFQGVTLQVSNLSLMSDDARVKAWLKRQPARTDHPYDRAIELVLAKIIKGRKPNNAAEFAEWVVDAMGKIETGPGQFYLNAPDADAVEKRVREKMPELHKELIDRAAKLRAANKGQ